MRTTLFLILTSAILSSASFLFSGTALFMDGDGDFLNLFEPVIAKAPFTVEGWALMASSGGGTYEENCLFEQRSNDTGFGAATVTLLAKNAHLDEASFELRDSESGRIKLAGPIRPIQEWHHYAGVVDSEKIRFYIDGALVNSMNYHFTGSFDSGIDNISIGRHAYENIVAGYFNGMIDEMRIWDVARSEQEIRDGMNRTIDLNSDEASYLLAYWRFDDFYEFWKNGEQYVGAKDLSGHEHHAAFMDDAWLVPRDAQPQAVPLVDFDLLSPAYNAQVNSDAPMLRWQPATTKEHLLNSELEYTIYVDKSIGFENAALYVVYGNRTCLQLHDMQGGQYVWKVKAVNAAGEYKWSNDVGRFSVDLTNVDHRHPKEFLLLQNYPNPFNPQTTIEVNAPVSATIRLRIFDVNGRLVKTLVDAIVTAGLNRFIWNGDDEVGSPVSAGIYFCRLETRGLGDRQQRLIKKMSLLR